MRVKKKDGDEGKRLSRRNFLKIASAGSLVFGIGLIPAFEGLLRNKAGAIEQPSNNGQPFSYIIYKRGSETIAQKYGGNDQIHSTRPEEVIKRVLSDPGPADDPNAIRSGPGHVYIRDGVYAMETAFTGFDLRSYTTLTLGPQAILRVPSGYSGYVFRLQSNGVAIRNCMVNGGFIEETNPPERKWVGISLHGISDGVFFNKFSNMHISNAGNGIELKASSTQLPPTNPNFGTKGGWVNANSFESLTLWQNKVFIDFVMDGEYKPGTQSIGIHRNRFINLECQSGPHTTHGIRNIKHYGNSFIAVNVWDISGSGPGAITSNIDQQAEGTLILSGIMTGQNFTDHGTNTKVIDESYSKI